MKRPRFRVATLLVVGAMLWASNSASAQCDAAWKIRGDFGMGWPRGSVSATRRGRSYRQAPQYVRAPQPTPTAPGQPQVTRAPTARRQFSLEPGNGAQAPARVQKPTPHTIPRGG